MPDVEESIRLAKERIAAAQRDQAQAEHSAEVATREVREAVKALREEFGINSITEAEDLIARLRAERDAEVARVNEALDRIGGEGSA